MFKAKEAVEGQRQPPACTGVIAGVPEVSALFIFFFSPRKMNLIGFNSENDSSLAHAATRFLSENLREEPLVSSECAAAACVAGRCRLIASSWQLST